jgi:S-adenosylmethionine:tRNA ribosyltransferase-isomerase
MDLAELDYHLPAELIAQAPRDQRAAARLLVVDRGRGEVHHSCVAELTRVLRRGDVLVLNDTKVIPARLHARRPTGGRVELLLVRATAVAGEWEALARGTLRAGEHLHFAEGVGRCVAAMGDGRWRVRLPAGEPVLEWLERVGEVPLPPYIRRPGGPTAVDRERYQTVFAADPGAIAAPTAGLHFTTELLGALTEAGIERAVLTLHVGPGTFLPIRRGELDDVVMEPEAYAIPEATVARVLAARREGRRVVAVGTTTTRALESAAAGGPMTAGPGEARLFIRPGHRFRAVDALLTNFHLPRSPLLALVAALAGWERVRAVYTEAVRRGYRFYSFGDAMLIV